MLFCKDCKHLFYRKNAEYIVPICNRKNKVILNTQDDLVTKIKLTDLTYINYAYTERSKPDLDIEYCGIYGKYWEAKE